MTENNISFKATFAPSRFLKTRSGYACSRLNRVQERLSAEFMEATKEFPKFNLEAYALDISNKEIQFKLKIGEKIISSGFYDFWADKKKINTENLIKIFNDLRSKSLYNKNFKNLQEWYSSKLETLKNDTSRHLDEVNRIYAQRLKNITEQREKEKLLYKLEV